MAIEKILRLPVNHYQRKIIQVLTPSQTSFAPQKKRKKNTPKKSSGGLELNQPSKITVLTDFFHSIRKNTHVPCHEKPPDPNVRNGLRRHVDSMKS